MTRNKCVCVSVSFVWRVVSACMLRAKGAATGINCACALRSDRLQLSTSSVCEIFVVCTSRSAAKLAVTMKDVIDVMQLQREKARYLPAFDYRQSKSNFTAARFLFECGMKLDTKPLTIATAAIIFHKFCKETDESTYDSYLIAATSLYLAGKMRDDQLKIRDVINVAQSTMHRGSPPLELGDEYWNVRDGIVQAELLIMRILKFEVSVVHPHKYMLHYLKALEGWYSPVEWRKVPIARASFAFLQDFHFDQSILLYSPQHIAVACINLALQCYGSLIPGTEEAEGKSWFTVFAPDLQKDMLWEIMEKVMDLYNKEPESL